jgi:hypothetical protein
MAWKKEQNRYMDLLIRVLKDEFEGYYNRWNGVETDDRAIFCRMYEIIIENANKMRKVNSSYIMCAVNEAIDDDKEKMRETISYFTGQTTRCVDGWDWSYISTPEEVIE